ncbi:MAG: hypothetical protein HY706_09195 [Candidatus Hydrogenedentes bacterium]|nr:hypothetical protein [Candidatus Hydrogenedentota bacterium]
MPQRLRFRLETLLRVRHLMEERKATALAGVRRQVRAAEVQRADIIREQMRMLDEAGQLTHEEFDAADVRRYYQYERYLARQAVEKDALLMELRGKEVAQRAELEEAMKRKRIIERLKERHEAAQVLALVKFDQWQSDEVAVNAAAVARRYRGEL